VGIKHTHCNCRQLLVFFFDTSEQVLDTAKEELAKELLSRKRTFWANSTEPFFRQFIDWLMIELKKSGTVSHQSREHDIFLDSGIDSLPLEWSFCCRPWSKSGIANKLLYLFTVAALLEVAFAGPCAKEQLNCRKQELRSWGCVQHAFALTRLAC